MSNCKLYTVREEITKHLINEGLLSSFGHGKRMPYKELLKLYNFSTIEKNDETVVN